jgi:hypothetical protein
MGAGSQTEERAPTLMTRDLRMQTNWDNYLSDWDRYLFAELVGQPDLTEKRNTFYVYVRYYGVDGSVVLRLDEHRLKRENGEILLDEIYGAYNAPVDNPVVRAMGDYDRVTVTQHEPYTYQLPRSSSSPALTPDTLSAGGSLIALCQLEISDRIPEDAGWWVRTPQGWIPSSWVDLNGQPMPNLIVCDPNHADR